MFIFCSKNQLQKLPEHICSLSLQVLIVSHNRMSCVPDEIRHLKHIQYLVGSAHCSYIAY